MLKTKKTLKGVLKMELAYRMEGDYWIPNLVAPKPRRWASMGCCGAATSGSTAAEPTPG